MSACMCWNPISSNVPSTFYVDVLTLTHSQRITQRISCTTLQLPETFPAWILADCTGSPQKGNKTLLSTIQSQADFTFKEGPRATEIFKPIDQCGDLNGFGARILKVKICVALRVLGTLTLETWISNNDSRFAEGVFLSLSKIIGASWGLHSY